MEILTEKQLAEKLDFRSPLREKEEATDMWPIPFEYGGMAKGTRISVSKARYIAAELRAEVAEHDLREVRKVLKVEQDRNNELGRQVVEARERQWKAENEILMMKVKLRKKGK